MKICIVDKLGLCYDGTTLKKQGLGGSESAVILIAQELSNIGFDVTVINNCVDASHSKPGIYDGVRYIDNKEAHMHHEIYDAVIVSRSISPFLENSAYPFIPTAQKRILWLHDTFIEGDQLVEQLILSGVIHHIFTLSDFHTNYILNCDHGARRNFEVLKKYIFQTRNGAVTHIPEVDLSKKDKNHFVYNASATKGLLPLVDKIWPLVKQQIPDAHLTVIGGYYRFREGAAPDQQENTVRRYAERQDLKDLGVTFVGVIPQNAIAEILANAYMMIYPGAFPETFGISSLESLLYNTPLVTTRFGALEETAFSDACFLIDYAIEPNSLFPNINLESQVQIFVKKVIEVYNNPYLYQQKQNACNTIKDIAGWDSVAKQWQQFLYKITDRFLPVEQYQEVSRINNKVARVFGRTHTMPITKEYISFGNQKKIAIVSPFWNAESYIERHIMSVAQQDYDNYIHILIDDASTDKSIEFAKTCISNLPINVREKFVLLKNDKNQGAIFNQLASIEKYVDSDTIVMLLDGDDWLVNNNTIFHYYNDLYNQGYEFTYGSMWSVVDNIPLVAQPYPLNVKQKKSYRNHLFNWKIPYTHLRTCESKYFKNLDKNKFKDVNGNWMKSGADNPLFYELIEQVPSDKIFCNSEIVCNYNDANPLNDYKIRGEEQNKNANKSYLNQYSVVVPTLWRANASFIPFLKELVNHHRVGEIILIDNDNTNAPNDLVLIHPKIKRHSFGKNIYVNPAWNFGVSTSVNDKICIVNDDLSFDTRVFDKLDEFITPENGVIGLCPGVSDFNQPPYTDGSINISEWGGQHTYGFGCLMFIHKDSWMEIPKGLDIYFGDNYIFDMNLRKDKKNYIISNIRHNTRFAQTTSDTSITSGFLEREKLIYQNIMNQTKKKILVAIPTNKYIEPDTFKSIFDLSVPDGYELDFQYFYGYQIDQIRNLIADWGKRYDYLFSVDSDIVLPSDCLVKMLSADKDIISGLYIQRIPDRQILEIYKNADTGVTNHQFEDVKDLGVFQIASCGMGCCLIKSEVLHKMSYPHFVYTAALSHAHTFSEDIYFCCKAREIGFTVWADSTIRCEHVGQTKFVLPKVETEVPTVDYATKISNIDMLPVEHANYLRTMEVSPKVVYDIGACVLHWTNKAKEIWPTAQYYLFDANDQVEPVMKASGHPYWLDVLTDQDGKELKFYKKTDNLGGNSYYKENTDAYSDTDGVTMTGWTLDGIVDKNNWPTPELIKIDVQGAEIDILKGATKCLTTCNDIIIEAQHVNYNDGAPSDVEVFKFMDSIGYEIVSRITYGHIDSDFHFRKKLVN
jgi:FkbM family methyltransferase